MYALFYNIVIIFNPQSTVRSPRFILTDFIAESLRRREKHNQVSSVHYSILRSPWMTMEGKL